MNLAPKPNWTHIRHEPFVLHVPEGVANPVLTGSDVTDVSATGVADPFLFHEKDIWHMFFEVISSSGCHIGHATSPDGLRWAYDRIALYKDDVDTHQAFPLILQHDDSYYMIPDPGGQTQVWIYQASDFPYGWSRMNTIVSGRRFVDPSIFVYDDTWWMFLGGGRDCLLYR
jgi:sucrose-6-phosphate hydrolase SacC (GH32 family)